MKRYCGTHLEEYLAKRKEAKKREKTMPRCACGKLAKVGQTECSHCLEKRQRAEAYEAEYAALPKCECGKVATRSGKCQPCTDKAFEETKMESFEAATTFEELKDWIREYMI